MKRLVMSNSDQNVKKKKKHRAQRESLKMAVTKDI